MAKDKKDKGKKNKVPKELGGVKVPKKLRKLGNQAAKLAKEPVVAEVVAGALLAAAAALREGKDPKATVGAALKGGMKTAAGGAGKKGAGAGDGARLSDGLKLIALDFARRALEPREKHDEGQDDAPRDETKSPPQAPPQPKAPPGEVPRMEQEPVLESNKGKGLKGG